MFLRLFFYLLMHAAVYVHVHTNSYRAVHNFHMLVFNQVSYMQREM